MVPLVLAVALLGVLPVIAQEEATVGLGAADSFAILGGETATNTGPSVIGGNVGVSPGSTAPGFDEATVSGDIHLANDEAAQAQAAATIAYDDAASRSPTDGVGGDLGGQTLLSGVYNGDALELTGTLTLDAQGDPNAVFIFQAASSLLITSGSQVALVNGAQACNVFWQVTSSATIETGAVFAGTILALTSISAQSGATVDGRLLARTGEVTLINNTVVISPCATETTTTTAPTDTTTTAPTDTTDTTAAPTSTTTPATPTLPFTGADRSTVGMMGMVGLIVLILGVATLRFGRRNEV